MKHILIIDDDVHIGNLLEQILTGEGYATSRAYSGTEAAMYLGAHRPDLILLDLMLPGLTGEALLPEIRGIPVIVLSAKTDAADKADLLLGGAADYVTKPFDTRELLARIAVQFRRPTGEPVLTCGEISMDTAAHGVTVAGTAVRLTKTEYAILKLLLENPDQVIPKSTLLDNISRDTPDCVESSLKVHVSNLRRKLREAGGGDCIEAVWGIGFKLRGPQIFTES